MYSRWHVLKNEKIFPFKRIFFFPYKKKKKKIFRFSIEGKKNLLVVSVILSTLPKGKQKQKNTPDCDVITFVTR